MELPAGCPSCAAALSAPRCGACGAAAVAGGYRIRALIAQTAHGRTYRAEGALGVVALKELVFALVPTTQQLEAFERESSVLRSLSHPSIPRFVESFQEGEGAELRLYLAQELIEGEPLSALLGRRSFSEGDARRLLQQLLPVLGYLHARSLVHRDLKPANVLRRADGSLVLVDFGSAREVAGITHGATLVGTFGYMPPEQLGGTVDARSDLYALGATVIHLLGERPPSDLFDSQLRLRLDHLSVSRGLRDCLSGLTARDPRARFRSAAEAQRALSSGDALRPVRRLLAVGLVGGLAALFACAALIGVGMFHPGTSPLSRDAQAEEYRRALTRQLQVAEHGSGPRVHWENAYWALESAEVSLPRDPLERERLLLANALVEDPPPKGFEIGPRLHPPGTLAHLRYEALDVHGAPIHRWEVRAVVPPLPMLIGGATRADCPEACAGALAETGGTLLNHSGETGVPAEWVLRMPVGRTFDLGARILKTHDLQDERPVDHPITTVKEGSRFVQRPTNVRVTLLSVCSAQVRVGALPGPGAAESGGLRWLQMSGCNLEGRKGSGEP